MRPKGYTWDDILYVIGGFNWKARFVDKQGNVITGAEDAKTQYNLANKLLKLDDEWVAYHPGETVAFSCGSCHTTGYIPQGNQGGVAGTCRHLGGRQCRLRGLPWSGQQPC